MSLPPPRQLEAFMAVAETRSFRLAADLVGMSQPALSQNIAQLEAHLDTVLFLRTTRSVQLTAEGAELREQMARLLPAMNEAMERTRNLGKEGPGTLRLGFLASAAVRYLPRALNAFRETCPDVAVHIRDDTAEGLFTAVHEGTLDLALSSYLPHRHRDVEFELLLADPFVAVLRRDHPLASRERITWAELLEHDFIGANAGSGTRYATDAAMRAIARPPRTVMAFNHFSAVAAMIEARMGVSALPMVNCPPEDHPSLCTVPLVEPVMTRDLGFLTRSLDGSSTRHVRIFRDCIIAATAG